LVTILLFFVSFHCPQGVNSFPASPAPPLYRRPCRSRCRSLCLKIANAFCMVFQSSSNSTSLLLVWY